eukprot:scaffold35059_cov31-Attheya_sp.AAC.1
MEHWKEGKYKMLVQDTVKTSLSLLSHVRHQMDDQEIARTYNRMVLQGKLRQAVRWITQRHKGGMLYLDDIDVKTGKPVIDVLKSNHPEARAPDHSGHSGERRLKVVRECRARGNRLCWIVAFIATIRKDKCPTLREAVADFTRWMANEMPPWASYRAMIASRCVALDNCPGVRPVGIGEIWRRLQAKFCAGLEAGIEGSIHAVNELWGAHEEEDEWGFLLVDATNAFNEGNCIMILWTVRHEWPSGARFTFNCYGHWGTLMVWSQNGTALFMFSMEGATQGDPLAMFIYGMGLLPLIRRLKSEVENVSQPWYADDAGAGGKFDRITVSFEKLEEYGPKYGYFPEASKSILIVREHNVERAKEYFAEMNFSIKSGYRYLGGFVGARAEMKEWIGEKADEWTA